MSNAKRRHRRRRRVWRRARMFAAVRYAATLGAEWVERDLGSGWRYFGLLTVRPMGSEE
jgi:hypothetical protein